MKSHCFYQGKKLSAIGSISEMSVILQSSFAPLAEQRGGAIDNAVLIAANAASSIVHAAGATTYAPYGHFDLIRHGSVLGFNGQAPDPVTRSYLLGNGKRVFSPSLMRFNSPDNLSPFGLGGMNAFAYCGGDPINFADPTGNIRHKNVPKRLQRNRPRPLERERPRPLAGGETDLPSMVVRPRINGEIVDGPASNPLSSSFQQPASSGATPTTPVLPTTMSGPFSFEERSYVTSVIQFAGADQVARPLIESFRGSGVVHGLVALIGRQSRGGVHPVSMDAMLRRFVPDYDTAAGRQRAREAQVAAHVAISIYQMRRGT